MCRASKILLKIIYKFNSIYCVNIDMCDIIHNTREEYPFLGRPKYLGSIVCVMYYNSLAQSTIVRNFVVLLNVA